MQEPCMMVQKKQQRVLSFCDVLFKMLLLAVQFYIILCNMYCLLLLICYHFTYALQVYIT